MCKLTKGFCISNYVQVQKKQNKIILDLKITDNIKTANLNYCHNFQNKLSCCVDKYNISYANINKLCFFNVYKKSIVKIITQTNKIIYSTCDCEYYVNRLQDRLNNYYTKPLYDILDSYQPNNFDYHGSYYRLVTEDGLQLIKSFDFIQNDTQSLVNIQTVDNENRIFINGILVNGK